MARAKKVADRAAANRSRMEAAKSKAPVMERVDVTRKENACKECATCGGKAGLEADDEAVGVYYCGKCWEEWEVEGE